MFNLCYFFLANHFQWKYIMLIQANNVYSYKAKAGSTIVFHSMAELVNVSCEMSQVLSLASRDNIKKKF